MAPGGSSAVGAIRTEARVLENSHEGGRNHRLRLLVPGWPKARPGQFVMLSPGAICDVRRDDPLLPRPMAVYRELDQPAGTAVEILYKVEGRGTALLAQALAGSVIRVVGPLGRAFPLPASGDRVCIVGGGTGVASLFGLARAAEVAAGPGRVRVLLGARTAEDLMARGDFAELPVELRISTEDGSDGERGLVTTLLDQQLGDGLDLVYCCGPTPMMRLIADSCIRRAVRCVVSLENNMACGSGVCLGCAVPVVAGGYALVCRDGPVFESTDVDWDGLP